MKASKAIALIAPMLFASTTFAKSLDVNPGKSSVRWIGKKVIGQEHVGTLSVQSGKVEVIGDELKSGQITIDMSSIKNEDLKDPGYNAKLIGHLKSDDFFAIEKHPTASFVITGVKPLKNRKDATHEITGDLTIRGTTHPISFPAKVEIKNGAASAQGKVTIDRTKYNIRYGSGKFFENLGDKMISDTFELNFDLRS